MYTNSLNFVSKGRQSGLTLIELIAAMVIISVTIAALTTALHVAILHSADPMQAKQARSVAESLLEEVLSQPFTFCDPDDANFASATSSAGCATLSENNLTAEAGETRGGATPLDNVNDYNGLTLSSITSPVDGSALPGLSGYNAVFAVTQAGTALGAASNDAALKVSVTVTAPDGTVATLVGYRFRHTPNGY